MRSLVFLASVLWVGSVFGGTLIGDPIPDQMPKQIGTVSFTGSIVATTSNGLEITNDATWAYFDLYGHASRMDLASNVLDDNERFTGRYEIVLSAQPEDLGNGWTRFSFRGQGGRLEMKRYREEGRGWYGGFGEGQGVSIMLHDGSYPVVEGFKNTPSSTRAILYDLGIQDAAEIPFGSPLIIGTRETLDPPFGDATGDGRIDIADFGTLKDGFGQPTTPYQNGDVTGNLTVDMADFGILKQNFGWKQEAAVVPEPSAFALLLLGIGAFFLRLFTK
jgi:hypothetical protein